jgi:hypothetical protein
MLCMDLQMKPKFSTSYLAQLFEPGDYQRLAEMNDILRGADAITDAADYGLSRKLFLFCEGLDFFAQSIRSGAWTYFEAVPHVRQLAFAKAARAERSVLRELPEMYEFGRSNWRDPEAMRGLDRWIGQNEAASDAWLWQLVVGEREEFLRVVT